MTQTRARPRTLPSYTTKLATELGNLYVTVSVDDSGEPFEVFGHIGKAGSFTSGVTELTCRLISLHLRRGTPVGEIVDQCQGSSEMQPFVNKMPDGTSIWVRGLGDGIAHVLRSYPQDDQAKEEVQEEDLETGIKRPHERRTTEIHEGGAVSAEAAPLLDLEEEIET